MGKVDIVLIMNDKARVLRAWVGSIPGVGPKRFEQLRSLFPNLEDLLSLPRASLLSAGIPEKLAALIIKQRTDHSPDSIAAYCLKHKITMLAQDDEDYPHLLREIPDPPIVLYAKGILPNEKFPKIGVVGTRQMTDYGRDVTHELTSELAKLGCVIVSGFMYGVDAYAHKTAIDAGGKTIGVLGFGFDHMYPREHRELALKMIDSGNCLVTEFAPWQAPTPGNFPARNRIVSGMCLGIVVTEAARKSGSKITARLATEQGREVFAVPGPMHSAFSEGTKELVNMGAKLVTSAADIVEELPPGTIYSLDKEGNV